MGRFEVLGAASVLGLVLAACAPSEEASNTSAQSNEAATPAAPAQPLRDASAPKQSGDSYYIAAAEAVATRTRGHSPRKAKNVILFVGDGMGISTVTAGRIHAGQLKGEDGESYRLAMESLPHSAFSKTYSHDAQVSDSASTATAMVAGVKVRSRTLGITQGAAYSNCASVAANGTDTIFELAEAAGLSTGVISTARLTHATPASTYSESANRDWENDSDMPGAIEEDGCPDIARQFIDWDAGDHFEIALGGGRSQFLPRETVDPEYPDNEGDRTDGRDLMQAWADKSDAHVTVTSAEELSNADIAGGARVLGLFQPSHMRYEVDRADDPSGEPSLKEMTRTAITRLSQDEDGYVLMVEAGRIDHGHHGTNAARALGDTVALDEAVAAALDMTSDEDTLIIVTADHSHTFVIQGYPIRNNPILGKVALPDGSPAPAGDGKPYTTLSYANGSSAYETFEEGERIDLSDVDTEDKNFKQQSLLASPSETHAGEDVPIYARGPGAELVAGTMEQNEIFHVMGQASGLIE